MKLEGDAEIIINASKRKDECLAWYGDIIKEAKCHLKSHPLWKLSFTHREGNKAAHTLAKYGLAMPQEFVWINKTLKFLSPVVMVDPLF